MSIEHVSIVDNNKIKNHQQLNLMYNVPYLIVIGEGNDGATNPKNHGGMNFTMCVCVRVSLIWIVPCIHKILPAKFE